MKRDRDREFFELKKAVNTVFRADFSQARKRSDMQKRSISISGY